MSWMGSMSWAGLVLYVAVGAGLGALYFFLLYRTVRLHAAEAAALRVVPLYLLRAGAALAVFWAVAQQGALPLLLALLGFLVARLLAQRWTGSL